jgi:hypothetical protein
VIFNDQLDDEPAPPRSPPSREPSSETVFSERSRPRMRRIESDDEDDTEQQQQQQQRQQQQRQRLQQQQQHEIAWPDTDDEGEDYVLFQGKTTDKDDTSASIYTDQMEDFDYRRNPPPRNELTADEKKLVEEDLKLIKQKGNNLYQIIILLFLSRDYINLKFL